MTGVLQRRHGRTSGDRPWNTLREEAEAALADEPLLAALLHSAVLSRRTFQEAFAERAIQRLAHDGFPAALLYQTFIGAFDSDEELARLVEADFRAALEHAGAPRASLDIVLYDKGLHALGLHRLGHWLWQRGRRDLALYLQSRVSEALQVDIHPAAELGDRIALGEATGIVIGETAVVDADVHLSSGVTLGGVGPHATRRHPRIGTGSSIGAGAKLFGAIEIAPWTAIPAGSVMYADLQQRSGRADSLQAQLLRRYGL